MRQPLQATHVRHTQASQTGSIPAPVGGWNTRDSVAAMSPLDAPLMDNFYPSSSEVQVRPGISNHKTGFAARVKTLMSYAPATAAGAKLFACTNSGVFDATTAGAVGASVTTLTNGYGQHANFRTAAGSFLEFVNGTDNLKLFDGATWTTVTGVSVPAITGVNTNTFININVFKRRLWFVQKDTMSAWYLPVDSIAGAATEFLVGQYFRRGGFLVATATWTVDGGEGTDDYLVFISSQGELAVFQGTDPNNATTFGLIGVFYIGEPVGFRCYVKYGGDVLYISRQGLYPLSKALQTASIDRSIALSDKISPTFTASTSTLFANEGWQPIVYPNENAILVNVPVRVGAEYHQYVMNSTTSAWCRFKGWEGNCWEVFNGELYAGGETTVFKAWTGINDLGNNINAQCDTAYQYFGDRIQLKHIKLVRPVLETIQQITLGFGFKTDYGNNAEYSETDFGLAGSTLWDAALWDMGTWVADPQILRQWSTVAVPDCYSASFSMRVSTKSSQVRWFSTDYLYQTGGVI